MILLKIAMYLTQGKSDFFYLSSLYMKHKNIKTLSTGSSFWSLLFHIRSSLCRDKNGSLHYLIPLPVIGGVNQRMGKKARYVLSPNPVSIYQTT